MYVNAPDWPDLPTDAVHTIDAWFSPKRRRWIVERLDRDGHPIGPAHQCRSEAEARACLEDWRRRHPETHLSAPVSAGRLIRPSSR